MKPVYDASGNLIGYWQNNPPRYQSLAGLWSSVLPTHSTFYPANVPAPVSTPTSTPAGSVIVGDAPAVTPVDPNTVIAGTSQDSSGYGSGFFDPSAIAPGQSGLSGVTILSIGISAVATWLWWKHFFQKKHT